MKIILASGSPRRQQLLTLAGIEHEVIVTGVDETIDGAPDFQVRELALRKGRAVLPLIPHGTGDCIIVAADTLVYIDGEVLGKPDGEDEAFRMLKSLQGRAHTVYTGVALIRATVLDTQFDTLTHEGSYANAATVSVDTEEAFVDTTDVFFRSLTDEEICAYIATGEPFDKAGAYGVQERGAVLVDRVEGDFYTVVGLPISKVYAALSRMV